MKSKPLDFEIVINKVINNNGQYDIQRIELWTTSLIKNSGGVHMAASENGWNEYSRLVLEQLEVLSVGIDALRTEMQELRQELAIMKAKEDKITELRAWKEKIDEVASPTQIKTLVEEVRQLREFKTKAVTTFMVVQFLMGIALAVSKMF